MDVSSLSSRWQASSGVSEDLILPPGNAHLAGQGKRFRATKEMRSSCVHMTADLSFIAFSTGMDARMLAEPVVA
jgi:hypothetical protein